MKLDFVCIGAQKCGTTKLHDIFNNHDLVQLPKKKEAHFFEIDEFYSKGIDYFFSKYNKDFVKNNEVKHGLFNPNLQLDEKYIKRILDFFPEIKIIFIMRNPVDRAFSHYKMSKLRGYETNSFVEALRLEKNRLTNPKKNHSGYKTKTIGHYEKNHFGYIYRGKYLNVLHFLRKNLDKNNFKVILFEDLFSDLDKVVNEVCDFIDLPKFNYSISKKKSNQSKELRSKLLNNILFGNSSFINKFKYIIPYKLKIYLKEKIRILNSKNSNQTSKINREIKTIVYNKYFKNEINNIEYHFNLDLSKWKY